MNQHQGINLERPLSEDYSWIHVSRLGCGAAPGRPDQTAEPPLETAGVAASGGTRGVCS